MSWKNIKLVFLREVRDQLRDRRTLFMITILPVLLYPMLGLGIVQMMLTFTEQQRVVVVLNADQLPQTPELLDENGLRKEWFDSDEADASKLRILTGSLSEPRLVQTPLSSTLRHLQLADHDAAKRPTRRFLRTREHLRNRSSRRPCRRPNQTAEIQPSENPQATRSVICLRPVVCRFWSLFLKTMADRWSNCRRNSRSPVVPQMLQR